MKAFKFVLYPDADNRWHWRLLAANGITIGESTKSYERQSDLENLIVRLKAHLAEADVIRESE